MVKVGFAGHHVIDVPPGIFLDYPSEPHHPHHSLIIRLGGVPPSPRTKTHTGIVPPSVNRKNHRVSHQIFCQSIKAPLIPLRCHERDGNKTRQPLAGKCMTAKKSAYRMNFHHAPPPAPDLSVK